MSYHDHIEARHPQYRAVNPWHEKPAVRAVKQAGRCQKCGAKLSIYNPNPKRMLLSGEMRKVCDPCYNSKGHDPRQVAAEREAAFKCQERQNEYNRKWQAKSGTVKNPGQHKRVRLETLRAIEILQPAYVGEICSYLGMKLTTTKDWLKKLRAEGLADIKHVKSNRFTYSLTPAGEKLLEEA